MLNLALPLALALLLPGTTPNLPEAGSPESVLTRASDSLVTVRYVLEQEGAEFGGFTQRSHLEASGILVGKRGQVMLGGEIFPQDEFEQDARQHIVEFEIEFLDGDGGPADFLGIDKENNLVFLQLKSKERTPFIRFESTERPALGTVLSVVGRLAEGFGGTPLVKQVRVAAVTDEGYWVLEDILDLRFLGGPVFDASGASVGFLGIKTPPPGVDPQAEPAYFPTFVATVPRAKRFGLPVVIPANLFSESMKHPSPLPKKESQEKAWIGVTLQAVASELAEFWGMPSDSGVAITSVIEGSPASRAGLQVGDVVLEYNGDPVRAEEDADLEGFIRTVQRTAVGHPVPLKIFRDGSTQQIAIQLGQAPMPMRTAPFFISRDFGMKVRNLTFDFLQRRNLPSDLKGVVVEELESGGWARVSGLQIGDVILEVLQTKVEDVDELKAVLETARESKRQEVVFFVQSGPNTTFLSVKTDF